VVFISIKNTKGSKPLVPLWCRGLDSNQHERGSLPPQDSVSANSTTTAQKSQIKLQNILYKLPAFMSIPIAGPLLLSCDNVTLLIILIKCHYG